MRSFIPQEGGLSNLAFSRSLFAFLSVAVVIVGMGFLVNSPGCKTSVIGPDSLLADTTSHSFVWRVDTLGDGNSSVLFDVSILNVNDIWCVGQIFLKDSLGQFDPQMYNAAHWAGTLWNLLRISVRDFGGNTGIFTLRSVRAFSGSDVWFVSDGDLIHWVFIAMLAPTLPSKERPFLLSPFRLMDKSVICTATMQTICIALEDQDPYFMWHQMDGNRCQAEPLSI